MIRATTCCIYRCEICGPGRRETNFSTGGLTSRTQRRSRSYSAYGVQVILKTVRTYSARAMRWLSAGACAGSMGAGCRSAAAPDDRGGRLADIVATTGTAPDGLLLVDAMSGRVASRIDVGGTVEGLVSARDGSALYAGVVGAGFRRTLVALDGTTGRTLWTLPLSDNGQPTVVDGIGLLTAEILAASPDNRRLYVARALQDTIGGIVVLDLTSRRPVAFTGPWSVAAGGAVALGADPAIPLLQDGVIAMVASRQNSAAGGPRTSERVYFLAPTTLAVLDSITPDALGGSPTQDIWQIAPAPDGRTLYVGGSERVARYDLATRRVTASVARPSLGTVNITGDGSAVVITDPGRWPDSPGSGLLFVYGPDLVALGTIDVSTPLGNTPRTSSATVTGGGVAWPPGHVLYIRAGTPAIGPTFPPQKARLLAVDVLERRLLHSVELGGYGLGPLVHGGP